MFNNHQYNSHHFSNSSLGYSAKQLYLLQQDCQWRELNTQPENEEIREEKEDQKVFELGYN